MTHQLQLLVKKHNRHLLLTAFVGLGILSVWCAQPTPAVAVQEAAPADISTFIPRGHLLIPIELKNTEQLDGLINSHGIVDLFEDPVIPGRSSRAVGRRVRLIRAPHNPQVFAVLVKESEAETFLSYRGKLIASIRPEQSDQHEVRRANRNVRIEFQ